MTHFVGIDAGGTKLAVAVVEPSTGQVLVHREAPTGRDRGGEAILGDVADLVRDVASAFEISAIGIGVPELVTLDGQITTAVNWDWRDGTWKAVLASMAPVHVESDVRAAALGEARAGSGRGLTSFLYVTIGTGVSHTLVIGGVPWPGARGNAIVTGAPAVEEVASGPAMAARAGMIRAEEVLASPRGEPFVEEAASSLGLELARLVNALDPQAVVIGGGLGLARGFMQRVVSKMRPDIYSDSTRQLAVVPAALGAEAGVIGAALAAADAL